MYPKCCVFSLPYTRKSTSQFLCSELLNVPKTDTRVHDLDSKADFERAGAQWRTHAGVEDKEQQKWDIETYKQWIQDAKTTQGAAECGIAVSCGS